MVKLVADMVHRAVSSGLFDEGESSGTGDFCFRSKSLGLVVSVTVEKKSDGQPWASFRISRKSRPVSLKDVTLVREVFMGDGKAIVVLPDDVAKDICFHVCSLWKIPEF
jgi:hypothetical protein